MIQVSAPTCALRIVDHFGERTPVIDKESGRLREVEGIGERRRKLIKESWTEQRDVREIMIFSSRTVSVPPRHAYLPAIRRRRLHRQACPYRLGCVGIGLRLPMPSRSA